jgi:hypothetical protein
LLANGRWFSPDTPSSSTTKTGSHDIAEILLKVALKQEQKNQSTNRDHSRNCLRHTSLLFHKWLAERFCLDDTWIVNVGYKNTSISDALITVNRKIL